MPNTEYGYEDEDDYEDYDTFDDVVYGPDGEVVFDPWFESQKVEKTCTYCKSTFRGMPDHGVCDRCADTLEQGGDLQYSD